MDLDCAKVHLTDDHMYRKKKEKNQMLGLLDKKRNSILRKSMEKGKFHKINGLLFPKQQTEPDGGPVSTHKTAINVIKAKKSEMIEKIAEIRTEILSKPNIAEDEKLLLKLCSFIDEYYSEIVGFREIIQAIFSLIFGSVDAPCDQKTKAKHIQASPKAENSKTKILSEVSKKAAFEEGLKKVASIKLFQRPSSIEELNLGQNNQKSLKPSMFRITSLVNSSQSSLISKGTQSSQTVGLMDQLPQNKLKNLENFLRAATIDQNSSLKNLTANSWNKTAVKNGSSMYGNFFRRKDNRENQSPKPSKNTDKKHQSSKSFLPDLIIKSDHQNDSTKALAINHLSADNFSVSDVINSLKTRTHRFRPYKVLYHQLQDKHIELKKAYQKLMKKDFDFYETKRLLRETSLAETATKIEQALQFQLDTLRKEKFDLLRETLKTKFEFKDMKNTIIQVSEENQKLFNKCEAWQLNEHKTKIQVREITGKYAKAVQNYEVVEKNNFILSDKLAKAKAKFETTCQSILSQIEAIKQMDFRPFILKASSGESSQNPIPNNPSSKNLFRTPVNLPDLFSKNLIEFPNFSNRYINFENTRPAKGESPRFNRRISMTRPTEKKTELNSIDPKISIMRRNAQVEKSVLRLKGSSRVQLVPNLVNESLEWFENEYLFKEAQSKILEALDRIPEWLNEAKDRIIDDLWILTHFWVNIL